jgi:hypothetical protein
MIRTFNNINSNADFERIMDESEGSLSVPACYNGHAFEHLKRN